MTPEQLEKIFLPFEQAGDTEQRAEGTGLGLSICRQLVTLMGGEIQVKSELGVGSTFWFEVPLPVVEVELDDEQRRQGIIVGVKGKRRKVLAADDHQETRQLMYNMLTPLGFEIILAENGREAVERAKDIQPDLILMDLVMPVMTGFEAVKRIRQIPELQQVPIIAISASAIKGDQKKSQITGCNAFLPKPLQEDELLTLFETYLKLEWVYGEVEDEAPAEKAAAGPLIPPPQEELEILYELAMFGSMQRILERVTHLEELDQKYTPFVEKLRRFAKNYEDEQILALVEEFMERV
jgi:CheY-like chemotaxis protein